MRLLLYRGMLPLLILFAATLFAQGTGSITGTVRDNTGAVVAKADVTLTDTGTLNALKTTTNNEGEYLFAAVPPGTYNLSVSAVGFNTCQANGIVLRVAQRARVDATLSVGEVKTTVTVEGAGATQVETGTLNVYPNVDAIAEFKVLTSNYGAQHGTTTSKRATSSRPTCPLIRKTIFGYTVGGPVWHGALPTVNAADIIRPLLYNAAAFAAPDRSHVWRRRTQPVERSGPL